ncbi:uncharacterized protein BDV17DRAFT_185467 [Aspergillus undulatus]|uniref:uncharacterized protein n=1 Tax=Aspergillus undulatus TaxID=1810928 RepID=UPI003CCCC64B
MPRLCLRGPTVDTVDTRATWTTDMPRSIHPSRHCRFRPFWPSPSAHPPILLQWPLPTPCLSSNCPFTAALPFSVHRSSLSTSRSSGHLGHILRVLCRRLGNLAARSSVPWRQFWIAIDFIMEEPQSRGLLEFF